jgi:peptide/nickel transport system permease protein
VRSYLARRLASAVPVVFVVAIVGFVLFRLTPGDPAAVLAGDNASREQIERTRQYLGLDQPLHVQFVRYLGRLARADFGQSIFLGRPVTTAIRERLEPTVSLAVAAELFAHVLAIPLGLLAAVRANTWLDQVAMAFALAGLSIPAFWLGLLLVFSFGVKLGWLPVGEFRPLSDGIVPFLRHMILPAVSLGLIQMALTARMVRSSMLEVLREDYIRTAHAKGIAARGIVLRHALRNALIPTVTVIGLGFGALVSGAVVVETIFALPGLGRLTSTALLNRDYPLIQAILMFVAMIFIVMNLLVDLAYAYLDPRLRVRY